MWFMEAIALRSSRKLVSFLFDTVKKCVFSPIGVLAVGRTNPYTGSLEARV